MAPNETTIYAALLIAASVIAMILVFFVISLLQQHKRNIQLHKEKIQAEIATLEKERKRMASDLHDEVGPLLSAVKMNINSLDSQEPGDKAIIDKVSVYIDEMLAKVREVSNDLMPSSLARKGLYAAVEDLSGRISQSSTITVNASCEGPEELAKEKQVHVFRIIQEVIHNSIKHSSASIINIRLRQLPRMLTLDIHDNGKGFDYKKIMAESDGLGLKNILSRVELLGGVMYLDAEPGKGVNYSIEIPKK
ncbi:MAG TPA: sensor histidine kinase [Chitinophagaceae bacterium]|nr:sensor histidine kinase [Chitinophagaceae bacterium]